MSADQTIVLLADTHVPDRAKRLDPILLEAIAQDKPDQIFHAGDVSSHAAIEVLEQIAPVTAVMGNRDWMMNHKLPLVYQTTINGVSLTLTHGHISMAHYLYNYAVLLLTISKKSHHYYQKQLARRFPGSPVIIYGHTHYQVNETQEGILFINPGTTLPQSINHHKINYSVLTICGDGVCSVSPRALTPSPKELPV